MKKYKFSIVIAIGPGRKAEVIRSLETLDYPVREYEVFLENGINPSENRNRGAKKANGEIIAFIDDDAIVDRKLLRNAEEFFNKYKNIDIVGGPQLTPSYQQGFAKFSGYALASKFGAASASNRYKGSKLILNADETMLTSANLFCRRNVFNKVQFNPNLYPGEDPDFIEKSMKAGFKVAFDSNLIVYHKRRENLSGFVKQIYNYGLSRPKKESLIQTLKHASFIVPSIFLVYLVLLPILVNINLNFLIPAIFYLILSLFFSFYESAKNRSLPAFFVAPFIYLIIHTSYGLGFLIGSIKRILRV